MGMSLVLIFFTFMVFIFVTVPWTMVPIMVKNRTVGISKGEAEIRCQDLLQLLCSVFQETLEFGIKQLSLYGGDLFEDKRLSSVKKNLCKVYRRIQSNGMTLQRQNLTHRDIEIEAPFFPLCMQQLHSILLRNNRLRHHERFKYTLFLKDVGLPLAENIRFWEDFYSKPHCTSTSGCTHSWAGNDRNRYMYSIKHLYGLEGGRKNYASHSCSSLQVSIKAFLSFYFTLLEILDLHILFPFFFSIYSFVY